MLGDVSTFTRTSLEDECHSRGSKGTEQQSLPGSWVGRRQAHTCPLLPWALQGLPAAHMTLYFSSHCIFRPCWPASGPHLNTQPCHMGWAGSWGQTILMSFSSHLKVIKAMAEPQKPLSPVSCCCHIPGSVHLLPMDTGSQGGDSVGFPGLRTAGALGL